MNDIDELIKKYIANNKQKVYTLNDYLKLKSKPFGLKLALSAIIQAANGKVSEITNIIDNLAYKEKKYGRFASAYGDESNAKIMDLVQNSDGSVVLIGYGSVVTTPTVKKQTVHSNTSKYKMDGSITFCYTDTANKLSDIGAVLRELYPNSSNDDIIKMLIHIRQYCVIKKIGVDKVIDSLRKGNVRVAKTETNSFKLVNKNVGEAKKVILNSLDMISEDIEDMEDDVTFFSFCHNIKDFMATLLQSPVEAKPSPLLIAHGLHRSKLINLLTNVGLLLKEEEIIDKDENDQPIKASMSIKYKIPKSGFNQKLRKLYIKLFEKNLPSHETVNVIGEDDGMGGATNANISADSSFVQPVFPIQRRVFNK